MAKKICLVTGASSGIGKEIARGLAQKGAHVIIACRNPEKGQSTLEEIKKTAHSTAVDLLLVDLSSQDEIRNFAKAIHERYPKLDVLINNAATILTKKKLSVDGIEMTLATNYLAPFLLSQLLLDLLKLSSKNNNLGRIINISSTSQKWGFLDIDDLQFKHRKYNFIKSYVQSKLLLNIMTMEMARRLEGSINVNALHPGGVNTNLGGINATNLFLKIIEKSIKFFLMSPKKAAAFPIHLALSPEVEQLTGKFFLNRKSVLAHPFCYDIHLAQKIWKITEKMVGL